MRRFDATAPHRSAPSRPAPSAAPSAAIGSFFEHDAARCRAADPESVARALPWTPSLAELIALLASRCEAARPLAGGGAPLSTLDLETPNVDDGGGARAPLPPLALVGDLVVDDRGRAALSDGSASLPVLVLERGGGGAVRAPPPRDGGRPAIPLVVATRGTVLSAAIAVTRAGDGADPELLVSHVALLEDGDVSLGAAPRSSGGGGVLPTDATGAGAGAGAGAETDLDCAVLSLEVRQQAERETLVVRRRGGGAGADGSSLYVDLAHCGGLAPGLVAGARATCTAMVRGEGGCWRSTARTRLAVTALPCAALGAGDPPPEACVRGARGAAPADAAAADEDDQMLTTLSELVLGDARAAGDDERAFALTCSVVRVDSIEVAAIDGDAARRAAWRARCEVDDGTGRALLELDDALTRRWLRLAPARRRAFEARAPAELAGLDTRGELLARSPAMIRVRCRVKGGRDALGCVRDPRNACEARAEARGRKHEAFQLPTLERPPLVLEGIALHVVEPIEEARRLLVRLEARGSLISKR